MRPLLTLLAYSLFRSDVEKALKPAIGVEMFHNFTLMHDDIMDNAPLRRGKPTVHQKWNENIAILSGDTMLIKAFELFTEVENSCLRNVLTKFSKCATEVCEGQQWDMNFENSEVVSETDYILMIRQKTAALLGFSLELGAILAGADISQRQDLNEFGLNMGIGFQLKDDLLDVYADQKKFGKKVGGDIVANKKTFLLIKAMELADDTLKERLNYWLNIEKFDHDEKVQAVKDIYDKIDIHAITENKMNEFFKKAFSNLDKLNVEQVKLNSLRNYAELLVNRER